MRVLPDWTGKKMRQRYLVSRRLDFAPLLTGRSCTGFVSKMEYLSSLGFIEGDLLVDQAVQA